jgi:hypothetical protein
VPLSGQELLDFNEARRVEREKEAAQKAALARTQQLLEADEVESDDDDDDEIDAGLDNDEDDDEDEEGAIGGDRRQRIDGDGGGWADDSRQLSFDIYVKGQATRATSFFKSASGGAPRFRMFPFVEKRARNVDAYGEAVDVGVWLRKGKEIEEVGEDEFVKEAKRRRIEEEQKKVRPTTRTPGLGLFADDVRATRAARGAGRAAVKVRLGDARRSHALRPLLYRHGRPKRRPGGQNNRPASQPAASGLSQGGCSDSTPSYALTTPTRFPPDPRPRYRISDGRAHFGLQGAADHDQRGLQPWRARDGPDRRKHDLARTQSKRDADEHAQDGQG